jgi:hypothetical protein
MDTRHLLNIKSQTNDAITGRALSMISTDKKNTDIFKSAFDNQMAKKKNERTHSDKSLPQNGNDLPKKKVAVSKNNNEQQISKNKS